ncbi:MAG: oligosaccharide flippase family protein [Candidatus Nomurabacteria bacterium]|nr:MAG: oligosaccharide flippase family protein [Candidatus Nomurabacteria bacterium]
MPLPNPQLQNLYTDAKKDFTLAFRTGMLHLLSSSGIVQISGFVVTLVLVRVLSTESVGHIRLIHSVLDFLILLGDFGLAMAMLKYIAEPNDEEEKKSLLSHASYGILFTSLLTALLAFGLSFIPNLIGDATAQAALRWMVWLIPLRRFWHSCALGTWPKKNQAKSMV